MRTFKTLAQLTAFALVLAVLAFAGTTNFSAIQLEPTSEDSVAFRILNTSATPVFSISNDGTVTTSGGGFSLANDESLNTDTDAIFDFTRDDSGVVTITASDDNAVAALTVLPGGAAALTLGGASTTATTLTTDGTGNAEVVLPENSVGPDEVAVFHDTVILCGELAEAGTTYFGPSTGALGGNGADLSIGGTACDALDNTTEATIDAPIFTNTAFKVTGLFCKTDGTLGAAETIVYTARSAAADLTPTVTCTISVGETDCRSTTGSTTDIAAGATIAVSAVETSNNADDNGWCKLGIALK